jgi:addiction module HigA family antidote
MSNIVRMKNPSHPGIFVKSMVLEPLGLNLTDAAKALGVTRPAALSNLLNANASLSPEMAIRLDKAFGVDTEMLMRMQNNYDIARAK